MNLYEVRTEFVRTHNGCCGICDEVTDCKFRDLDLRVFVCACCVLLIYAAEIALGDFGFYPPGASLIERNP